MNVKQKIISLVVMIAALTAVIVTVAPTAIAADCTDDAHCCGGQPTSGIISCPQDGGGGAKESGVWGVLLIALNILTAGIGILAVGAIVFAAILYSSSQDDASQVKHAKDIIKNVVIGLVVYGAMYLLLNFLIPGGIFET